MKNDLIVIEERSFIIPTTLTDWIFSDYKSEEHAYREEIPESILLTLSELSHDAKIKQTVAVFENTFENDRALHLALYLPLATPENINQSTFENVFHFNDY